MGVSRARCAVAGEEEDVWAGLFVVGLIWVGEELNVVPEDSDLRIG